MTRTLWVLGLLALAVLVLYAMRRGWLNRARRHEDLPGILPAPPDDTTAGAELLAAAEGLYVGSTIAGDWQDRVTAGTLGNRSTATARLHEAGLLLRREGDRALWIPRESMRAVRADHKLANKVVPGRNLLVVTWRVGRYELDTGFRHEHDSVVSDWLTALCGLLPTDAAEEAGEPAAEVGGTEKPATGKPATEQGTPEPTDPRTDERAARARQEEA